MINKKKYFSVMCVFILSALQVQAQLTYLNGNIGVSNPAPAVRLDLLNTTSGDMFRCGMGTGNPIFNIYQTSLTTAPGKRTSFIYQNGAFEIFDRTNNVSRLWIDGTTGNISIGGQLADPSTKLYVNNPTNNGIFINALNCAFLSNVNHSGDYGTAQISTVNRNLSKSWAVSNPNYGNGNHYFFVSGDGWVYGRGCTWSSDARYKKYVQNSNNHNKIFELQAKSYKFDANAMKKDCQTSDYELSLLKTEYGFLAQEVQLVYPELVSSDENGYLSVNYVSFVPLLVEVAKEQKDKIASLEKKIETLDSIIHYSVPQKNIPTKEKDSNVIQSNVDTRLEMYVSPASKNASLNFYDLNGTQLKSYAITSRGKTEFVLNNNTLPAGIYIHNLIVDGVEVFSKRIIIMDVVTSSIR
jgi:hypothetical protein